MLSAQVLFDQPADTTNRPTEPKSHAAALRLSQTFEKVLHTRAAPSSSSFLRSSYPGGGSGGDSCTLDGYVDPGSNPKKHFLGMHT